MLTGRLVCSKPNILIEPGPHAQYGMFRTLDGHREMVNRCLDALIPIADTFDVVLVTGLSGTVPGATVALALDKELMILRRRESNGAVPGHGTLLEGDAGQREGLRYMVVDDFVSSGATLRRLMEACPTRNNSGIVGVCLYAHPEGFMDEKIAGRAKLFSIYHDGTHRKPTQYELWRRPGTILFDIKRVTEVE